MKPWSLDDQARRREELYALIRRRLRPLLSDDARAHLAGLVPRLRQIPAWDEVQIEAAVRSFAAGEGLKLGAVAQPLRAALTGSHTSPGIFEVMTVLGQEESLARISDCIS